MTRGLSEDEAKAMIVRGFVEPVTKELPLEYAVEMNRLVTIELEGSIGKEGVRVKNMLFPGMPVRTWRWLGVNETQGALPTAGVSLPLVENGQGLVSLGLLDESRDPAAFFIPREINFPPENGVSVCIPAGFQSQTPIKLTFTMHKGTPFLAEDIVICAEKGSKATVVIEYTSKGRGTFAHAGCVRVFVGEEASLQVTAAQTAGAATHFVALGGEVAEKVDQHVIMAKIGATSAVSSSDIALMGDESRVRLDNLYVGRGRQKIDLLARIVHKGKKTVSHIEGRGVLAGESRKIFRDTLDFVSGSAGARGREEESVLMLSDKAQNLSVPVLLCGEDDVEGEHAASSGRPDEKTLFYLMSRGLPKDKAVRLIARGAVARLAGQIPDSRIRHKILAAVSSAAGKEANR